MKIHIGTKDILQSQNYGKYEFQTEQKRKENHKLRLTILQGGWYHLGGKIRKNMFFVNDNCKDVEGVTREDNRLMELYLAEMIEQERLPYSHLLKRYKMDAWLEI